MLENENILWDQGQDYIAGIDEVGRGALAGPVVAAAVILPPYVVIEGVRDSKMLQKRARQNCLKKICNIAIDLGLGYASPNEIDDLNILNASLLAMQRAADSLECKPHALLIDGNQSLPDSDCTQITLVKGDRRSQSIAAASIVAKLTRDQLMYEYHDIFPSYGWNKNVGYPTSAHYEALRLTGPCIHHRRSFRLS